MAREKCFVYFPGDLSTLGQSKGSYRSLIAKLLASLYIVGTCLSILAAELTVAFIYPPC
ncbi:hypothetical protein CPB86DRAFT_778843 [Serendipita vermifera]|nr:hypothetical protein CPB86DRAFT_778843 [Serendipita vermifera]